MDTRRSMFARWALPKQLAPVIVLLLTVCTNFVHTRNIHFGKIAFESSCERQTWSSANRTCTDKGGEVFGLSDLEHAYGGHLNKLAIRDHATIWLDKGAYQNTTEGCIILTGEHIRLNNNCEEKHYSICRVKSDADFIFHSSDGRVPYQGCNGGTTKEPTSIRHPTSTRHPTSKRHPTRTRHPTSKRRPGIPATRTASSSLSYTNRTIIISVVCILVVGAGVVAVCYFNGIGKKMEQQRERRSRRRYRCRRR
ncbi:uncharacterized protein LOC124121610 [Haliotis rufescens]|uniref:uncharacterized protein LOC124121610 n=1 Tax=Haliotis rufescens TaxID=6454 RepID=UPI00201F7F84|nr:uncharacterized protein LOC124121610 [Haliotis rufescens]